MDDSGQVDSVVFIPPSDDNWHASFTHTTKILMPTLVTINLKDGQTINFVPVMLGHGASRDVLGGMLQNTTTQSPWIVKIQAWRWHETSNGHEYRLGTGALERFTPKMLGCVKCVYKTWKKSVDLSVLVVARVPRTMQVVLSALMKEPADVSGVSLLLGMVHSLFDIIREACGHRMMKLTDLKTDNIGVDEANRVFLLDVETASLLLPIFGDERYDARQKSRASQGMKTFVSWLILQGDHANTDCSWKQCIQHIEACIFTTWWRDMRLLPSMAEVRSKIHECLEDLKTKFATPAMSSSSTSPEPSEQDAQLELQTDEFQDIWTLLQPSSPQTPPPSESHDLSMLDQADPNEGIFPGVFWCVSASADSGSTDQEIQAKCIALGIQVPQFRHMDPHTRRRLPPNPERDTYVQLAERIWDSDWHKNGGPPRERPELNEDAHFMMRCLYRRLPLDIITKPTKSSASADQFARNYGRKFATFARESYAVHMVGQSVRIRRDLIHAVLQKWFRSKVNERWNTFQWEGFVMTAADISRTTAKACADWLAGLLSLRLLLLHVSSSLCRCG